MPEITKLICIKFKCFNKLNCNLISFREIKNITQNLKRRKNDNNI